MEEEEDEDGHDLPKMGSAGGFLRMWKNITEGACICVMYVLLPLATATNVQF